MCKFDLDWAKSIYAPTNHTAATKQQVRKGRFWPRARVSLYLIYCHSLTTAQLECIPPSSLKSGIKGHLGFPSHSSITTAQGKQGPCMNLSLSFSHTQLSLEHPHSCCVMYWVRRSTAHCGESVKHMLFCSPAIFYSFTPLSNIIY